MKFPQIGPAVLVTAAFIGPGTVITASLAGANFGLSLVWALVFSVIATIVLQEMAARLGIVTKRGLGENIRRAFQNPWLKSVAILLVVSAIVIGNAAYQGGNISGASLGLASVLGSANSNFSDYIPPVIGLIAFSLLWSGNYKIIEKTLIALVGLMSLAFLLTFIISQPDISQLLQGLLIPQIPTGATLTVIALIGTTVVPYNLFLHADVAKLKWKSTDKLPEARRDLYVSIPLGGLISIAILATAASAFFGKEITFHSAADLSPSLQPVLGDWAPIFMGLGLFAAGISSAVTAPLAAAFALSGILNTDKNLNSIKFKAIWITILILGLLVASSGYRPISVILFAQIANGILLPVITMFLLWIMNNNELGNYKNSLLQNIMGLLVLAVTFVLSARSLMSAFGLL